MTDVSYDITANSDDAADIGTTPTFDSDDNSYTHSAIAANTSIIGYRFQNVVVPAGATITAANLEVVSFATCSARGGCNSQCYMVAADDPDTWSDLNRPKDATLTTGWGNLNTSAADVSDGIYVLRDCNTANSIPVKYLYEGVQEVVDRVGWNSGQDMAVVFKRGTMGTGNSILFYNIEGAAGEVAMLEITYVVGGVVHLLTLLGVGV